jgi:hypothetical protein
MKQCRRNTVCYWMVTLAMLSVLAIPSTAEAGPKVVAYKSPPASVMARSEDFTKVEVRPAGSGPWQEVAVYAAMSSFAGKSGIAAFGLSAPAEVRVTYTNRITSAEVLPSRFGIAVKTSGKQAMFIVDQSQNIVLNVNDDIDHPLCLFANPIDASPPSANDPSVDYYTAGKVHRFRASDKKHVYIEGGAVVKGDIYLPTDAIPWKEIPHVRQLMEEGKSVKFSFRVNDNTGVPTMELAKRRSVSKQNNWAFLVDWSESWANELEFGWEID